MPVITRNGQQLDYIDEGAGDTLVLVHSSVSGNRQWLALINTLKDHYRVIAPNLFGYGETTPWSGSAPQTLADQAGLILALCAEVEGPIHLVGHSFGGAVALKTASLLGSRLGRLVLFEPTLFRLLQQEGRLDAFNEAKSLADHVRECAARDDWPAGAAPFADYWLGDGAWAEMPEKRRAAFAAALRPAVHEFDAGIGEIFTVDLCTSLPARTMIMCDAEPRRSVREIVEVLEDACPHWTFNRLVGVGHMAPLTRPDVVNPIIKAFLEAE
jgi:pimeloyl-ACP methyl ester carboxylesterase